MNVAFTDPELVALAGMVLVSYWTQWKLLLVLSTFGIWLYSYSISSGNVPFAIITFLFGLFTLVYGLFKARG
jgi:hypothetical protein